MAPLAASRGLTDDKILAEVQQNHIFPQPGQNFEAVIETQIFDGKPGPPRIVASHVW
jgi:hypothetical protein